MYLRADDLKKESGLVPSRDLMDDCFFVDQFVVTAKENAGPINPIGMYSNTFASAATLRSICGMTFSKNDSVDLTSHSPVSLANWGKSTLSLKGSQWLNGI
jgi:hypothetical protein